MSRQNASERQAAQRQARESRGFTFQRGAGGGQGNRNRRQVSPPAVPSAPSAPAAPAFTSSDGGTTYTTLPDGRQVYRPANSDAVYDRKTGQSVFLNDATDDPNDTQTYPHGFGLTQKDGRDYALPNSAPAPSRQEPARTSGPAPSTTITNANGVKQTGRNLSAINMPTLSEFERYAGGTIANFAGPSFPTQADTNRISDNFANTGGYKAQYQGETGGVSLEGRGGLKSTATAFGDSPDLGVADKDLITQTNKPGGPFSGAPTPTEGQQDPNARMGEQANLAYGNESRTVDSELLQGVDAGIAADGGTPPNRAGATLSKQLADSANMRFAAPTEQGEGAKYAPPTAASGEEVRRRAAFLDAPDSLSGLRAVERGMGMVYAGQKHYVNVNGTMEAIDSDEARAIKNAAPGEAQALKDKWVKALAASKTETPEAPSEAQNPTESGGSAAFKAGEPTFDADKTKVTAGTAEKLNGVPHSRDFTSNNTESEKPLFGNAPNITGNKAGDYNLAKKFYLK